MQMPLFELERVLGVEGGEGGEVDAVDPTRGRAVECDLPQPRVPQHELVGPLHVVQRPPPVLFP